MVEESKDREKVLSTLKKHSVSDIASGATRLLQHLSTERQVKFLNDALHSGKLPARKLRESLEDNARKEMTKGADKLVRKGKTPTVDLLLEDYRGEPSLQRLAAEVGLDEKWFTALAVSELRARGIVNGAPREE